MASFNPTHVVLRLKFSFQNFELSQSKIDFSSTRHEGDGEKLRLRAFLNVTYPVVVLQNQ